MFWRNKSQSQPQINNVERAVALAEPPTLLSDEEVGAEMRQIDEQLEMLRGRREELLGCEKNVALPPIIEKSNDLAGRRNELQRMEKTRLFRDFQKLSLEPLTWRDKDGYPSLVPFNLASPTWGFHVQVQATRDQWNNMSVQSRFTENVPRGLQPCFGDVLERLKERASRKATTITLKAAWTGVVPSEVKQAIREHQHKFESMHLLAEPTAWERIEEPLPKPIRNPDPLLVGFDGFHLWVIKKFDLTPLERYVASEFTA